MLLLFASMILFSLVTPGIHLTAEHNNAFYFGGMLRFGQVASFVIILIFMWRKVGDALTRITGMPRREGTRRLFRSLAKGSTHSQSFRRVRDNDSPRLRVVLESSDTGRRYWWRLPFLWVVLCSFDWALLILGAQLSETVIVAAVAELWPVFLIFVLFYHDRSAAAFFKADARLRHHSARAMRLSAVLAATVAALLLVAVSQTETLAIFDADKGIWDLSVGVLLGLLAAIFVAANVAASLVYARMVHHRALCAWPKPLTASDDSDPLRSDHLIVFTWLSMLILVVPRIISGGLHLIAGTVFSNGPHGITWQGLAIALASGVCTATGAGLLRLANGRPNSAILNHIMILSPVCALGWLFLIGVDLPRIGLFLAGAAMLFVISVAAQLRPRQLGFPTEAKT